LSFFNFGFGIPFVGWEMGTEGLFEKEKTPFFFFGLDTDLVDAGAGVGCWCWVLVLGAGQRRIIVL